MLAKKAEKHELDFLQVKKAQKHDLNLFPAEKSQKHEFDFFKQKNIKIMKSTFTSWKSSKTWIHFFFQAEKTQKNEFNFFFLQATKKHELQPFANTKSKYEFFQA